MYCSYKMNWYCASATRYAHNISYQDSPIIALKQGFSTGVPQDVTRGSARDHDWKKINILFLNLLAKINRSTEKYHSLLKRALTIIIIIIGLLYLQLTDHAYVPWAVDIKFFMKGFPETWKLFQGFLPGKKIEKVWYAELLIVNPLKPKLI
jgi:hypothetical protein